jgi:hypothetical protein
MEAAPGVTVMLESATAVTVRVVDPVMLLCIAEIVAVPALTALAVGPLMPTTEALLLDHVTVCVQSCFVLSDMVQVAMKDCV